MISFSFVFSGFVLFCFVLIWIPQKKGNRKNDWAGVIDEFCEQIDKNTVKDTVELLEADFSNATKIDKVNAKITIMDICKNYFSYTVRTCCGFPKITLTGTKEDWIKIYNKTEKLLKTKVDATFGKKWGNALLPVLQRYIYVVLFIIILY